MLLAFMVKHKTRINVVEDQSNRMDKTTVLCEDWTKRAQALHT